MSSLFYRNARLLVVSIILILVWGLLSFFTLPRLEDPELVSRNALVTTFLPGADAQRIEALITDKIERELSDIEEIETYESTSRTGSSIISIELYDRITEDEVDIIWSRVRDKIGDVTLPPGTPEPELEQIKVKAYAAIAALTWEQDDTPNYAILTRLAESLKDEFAGVAGTEEVEMFGDPSEEITVALDPADLTALNLTARDLSRQIQQSDAKLAAGQFRSNQNDLLLEVDSELDSIDRIGSLPIQFGGNGQFARLGDIAEVRKGIAEPADELAFISGRPGIALGIFVQSDYRLDLWSRDADRTLDRFREQLPTGLDARFIFSQSGYVEARLKDLIFNLFLGALLVFGVTLFVMGWQSAVVVASALPLSGSAVLGLMKLLEIPLHQMSVTGLIVALGLLIDTAIVVADEVSHRLHEGTKPETAIAQSIGYLSAPMLGSTLTTVLAFVPIALMPGGAGEFVGTIAINVILAVLSSLVISLTIVAALAARLYQIQKSRQSPGKSLSSWWQRGLSNSGLRQLYQFSLRWVFARPILGILLALILPVMGFVQAAGLSQQFFPPADRDQLQIELELSASASLEQTQIATQQVRELVLSRPGITDIHWFLGRSAPRFYYNLSGGREQYSNYAQGFVQLDDLSNNQLVNTLQDELDAALPAARVLVRQLEQGPPADAPVEMRIYGSNLQGLRQLGDRARASLASIPTVTHTRDSLSEVRPQLTLQLDEEELRLAGLDNTSVSQQLDAMLEGNLGGSILEETEELPVRVRVSQGDRANLDEITSLDLLPTSPRQEGALGTVSTIPLSALGDVTLSSEPSTISRRNGQRFNLIQGYLLAGVLPSEVLGEFQQRLQADGFELPPGYRTEIGGESEEQGSAVGGLLASVGSILVLTAATLVLSLDSARLAGVIGVVAGCAIGLGLLSLWVFGYPFGFMSIVGSFGLVGVAVNDSVVVLAALREDPKARGGNRKAVAEVVVRSTRHIIATTLTTAIGFVPLLLNGGAFWPPLAVAISGGVIGATLLALYFVPCAYLLLARQSESQ
ncbi:MAG: efflux RND transporter permease subunit [Geitlerinemataceae cyanobacterium]